MLIQKAASPVLEALQGALYMCDEMVSDYCLVMGRVLCSEGTRAVHCEGGCGCKRMGEGALDPLNLVWVKSVFSLLGKIVHRTRKRRECR